jgi:hypothetical protein
LLYFLMIIPRIDGLGWGERLGMLAVIHS